MILPTSSQTLDNHYGDSGMFFSRAQVVVDTNLYGPYIASILIFSVTFGQPSGRSIEKLVDFPLDFNITRLHN